MPTSPTNHNSRHTAYSKHVPKELIRKKTAERGYNNRWRKAREYFLAKYPLCVECEKKGRVEVATDVDHKIPHRGDMVKFWQSDNWQPLCHSCHSRKTAKEDSGFGNKFR